jgi:hypothetical protein
MAMEQFLAIPRDCSLRQLFFNDFLYFGHPVLRLSWVLTAGKAQPRRDDASLYPLTLVQKKGV